MPERVLVVGATGNVGIAAVKGALSSGREVLAIVRNQDSAEKLIKNVGSSEGITIVEASVVSDTGVKGVVDQVKAGTLPAFQHVYSCVGGQYSVVPLKDITTANLRNTMSINFEANFFAYRDTIEYLQAQNHPTSTWTVCTGASGEVAKDGLPAMSQVPLFVLATVAARENANTNVRVNEVYLGLRVEVDEDAAKHGVTSSTKFAEVYEKLLADSAIRGCRVRVESTEDIAKLRFEKKF